jgi:hypothetical protein
MRVRHGSWWLVDTGVMDERNLHLPMGRVRFWDLERDQLPADLDGLDDNPFCPSAVARYRWGRHLEEGLIVHAAEYMASDPFILHQHNDDERREFWLTIEFLAPPPLLWWGLMLGDALHSYRVALDHMMWEVAVRQSDPEPPPKPKNVSFPICRSEKGFAGWLRGLGFDLNADFVEWLRQLQPFGPSGSGFAELAGLNNADKHQVLPIIALTESSAAFGGELRPRAARATPVRVLPEQPLQTGSEMFRWRFDEPMEHVEMRHEPNLEPALPPREGEVAFPESLSQLMMGLQQLVQRTLHELPHRYRDSV